MQLAGAQGIEHALIDGQRTDLAVLDATPAQGVVDADLDSGARTDLEVGGKRPIAVVFVCEDGGPALGTIGTGEQLPLGVEREGARALLDHPAAVRAADQTTPSRRGVVAAVSEHIATEGDFTVTRQGADTLVEAVEIEIIPRIGHRDPDGIRDDAGGAQQEVRAAHEGEGRSEVVEGIAQQSLAIIGEPERAGAGATQSAGEGEALRPPAPDDLVAGPDQLDIVGEGESVRGGEATALDLHHVARGAEGGRNGRSDQAGVDTHGAGREPPRVGKIEVDRTSVAGVARVAGDREIDATGGRTRDGLGELTAVGGGKA